MHGWETRMLLKHYLERGVSNVELSRRFGVSRRTIHEWVQTGQLDRDLSRTSPRRVVRNAGLIMRMFQARSKLPIDLGAHSCLH